ncbi:MAG: hypothetical protein AMQ74_01684 [Candidatus Methanofastidiosum methylothiophilum]|uniref:Uncharacterized protein n=1 Tax=Candidatus Methanofastidiosum methylothiophilum TaxID=1705564 RepID=A0A150IRY5_9EURY|nr:MAG: hypothetical protein AMQ74_01684 [Candidatus Methanofastidiosum methylthiophilus]
MTSIENEVKRTKDLVREILAQDERARNDDKWLILKVIGKITRIYIPYQDLEKIPSFETITRVRRKIQNEEGMYLPTKKVKGLREDKEEIIRENIRKW